MLIGTYNNSVGEKNRVAFPTKFKNELGGELIITKGYEKCLIIVDKSKFDVLLSSLKDIPFVNSNIRDTKRFLIGSAQEIVLDKQGRFVIPSPLKDYAKLSNDVVYLGLLDWVELWDLKAWNEKEELINTNSSAISEKLSLLINPNRNDS